MLQEKAALLFKLRENTETNTDLIAKLYDFQDQGKQDAEALYKRDLLTKKREHKEELGNLRE